MRLLVHRGQALLLLIVGGLAGAVLAGALLERDGLPAPVASRAAQLMAPTTSHLPARIEIGSPSRQPGGGSTTATRETDPAAAVAALDPWTVPAAGGVEASPTPNTTVVPPTVYSYPASDHGHGSGGGSGSTPGGSGSGSGRGPG